MDECNSLRVFVRRGQRQARRGSLAAGAAARRASVLIKAISAAIDDPHIGDIGRVECDTGRRFVSRVDRPTSHDAACERVLEDFVCLGAVINRPQSDTIGHDVLWIGITAVKIETAGGVLTPREATRGARVAEDLVAFAVDDPDIVPVGGDAFRRSLVGH